MVNRSQEQIGPVRLGSHKPIGALSRGLAVLAEIGQHGADVAAIAKQTGINRTTVYRILATLEHDGYLKRSPTTHQFYLSPSVRRLSDGFTDALWITQTAAPALKLLMRETGWPGSLATFDGRHMVLRESTHRFNAFFIHKPMIGREIPLSAASGQAFLAFSAEAVRKPMLSDFCADWEANGYGRLNIQEADRLLKKVRAKGFATAIGALEPGVAAVAMPIVFGGQVLACVNVVMTPEVFHSTTLFKPIQSSLAQTILEIERKINHDWPT